MLILLRGEYWNLHTAFAQIPRVEDRRLYEIDGGYRHHPDVECRLKSQDVN